MKAQIPKKKEEEIETAILRCVRVWLIFGSLLYAVAQIQSNFSTEDLLPITDRIIHWVLLLSIVVLVVLSYFGPIKSIRVALVFLQIRIYYALFQREGVMYSMKDQAQILLNTVCVVQVCFTNQVIICQVFKHHYNKLNITMLCILYTGFFHRMIGLRAIFSKFNFILMVTIIALVLGQFI